MVPFRFVHLKEITVLYDFNVLKRYFINCASFPAPTLTTCIASYLHRLISLYCTVLL